MMEAEMLAIEYVVRQFGEYIYRALLLITMGGVFVGFLAQTVELVYHFFTGKHSW